MTRQSREEQRAYADWRQRTEWAVATTPYRLHRRRLQPYRLVDWRRVLLGIWIGGWLVVGVTAAYILCR